MALTKITNSAIADDIGLGGNPTTSTQTAGNSTTRIATTAFVSTAVSNLVDFAPGALNTLNELAAALGDDASFSTTVTNSIATKLPLAGGALTGAITTNSTFDGRNVSVDGTKLDTIDTSANNYSHPAGTGNNHIPTGGATDQFLKYSSSGTATWATIPSNTVTTIVVSSHTTYEYVATTNQTTFTGSDVYSATLEYDTGTPAKIQVFLNGILLDEGSGADYTATTGTSIVLTSGATVGDLVQISAYKSDTLTGNIGIGTTTPKAKLQVEDYGIDTTSTSSTATTQIAIHTFLAADFRSARFTVQVTNTTDSTYHITEILMIHNGTTAHITEFGEIHTGAAVEAIFDADILTGNVRLLATPSSTDSMTLKVVCHSLTL